MWNPPNLATLSEYSLLCTICNSDVGCLAGINDQDMPGHNMEVAIQVFGRTIHEKWIPYTEIL